jgi:predicted Zn-dependent protease
MRGIFLMEAAMSILASKNLKPLITSFVIGFGALLAGCQSVNTTQAGTVGVDRTQRMSPLVSEKQLQAGAAASYAEVLQTEKSKGHLNADPALTNRVKAIAARVIPTTSVFRPDAPGWAWEVNVIQSEELNAWCMPGGKIAFYSGIITKLQLNDDEIAAIMGHEIAHALREHGRERASEQMTSGLLVNVGVIALGGNQAMAEMAGLAYNVTVGLPNSRTHETEADRIGIELSARAGYDPKAAVTLWQKMAKLGGAKGPQFLSTHPSNEGRIKDLEGYSVRVQPLYEQARAKR